MFLKIIIKQLKHRWAVNLLLFLAMTGLVSLYTFILNTNRFTVRSMRLIMKQMGLNQLIIPSTQPALDTYLCTDNQAEFSGRVTHKLASHTELLSRYYVSVLQQRMEIAGHPLVVTGIQPVNRIDETAEKGNPVKPVKRGTVRLGSAASAALSVRDGGSVDIGSKTFTVAAVRPQQGTIEDYRVFLNLADMQELVGKPGRINAIRSFECLHPGGSLESIHASQKRMLSRVAPEFKQINIESIARGRYHARNMTEKYQYYLLTLVAAITVLIVIITGFQEVAERRYETGILMAQGAGYLYIVGLYLFKTLGVLIAASVVGFLLGGIASVWLTTPFLVTHTREVTILWENLAPTVAAICGVGLLAECIPMIKLVRMDPCAIVMEE